MNLLLIDTRNTKEILTSVVMDGNTVTEVSESSGRNPESILLVIERVLKKSNLSIHDIDEIKVEQGPGSYTGIKVGVSVANALSFSLQKKVNGKELGELVEPKYE